MWNWLWNWLWPEKKSIKKIPGRPPVEEIERLVNLAGFNVISTIGLRADATRWELNDFYNEIMSEFMRINPYKELTVSDMKNATRLITKWGSSKIKFPFF